MRIKISIVFCAIIAITMVSSTNSLAFDGNRKGFVAGVGVGAAPVVKWTRSFGDINKTDVGRAFNFVLGHGFGSRDVIVWNYTGARVSGRDSLSADLLQGVIGVQWYHFLSDQSRSFYGSIGVGGMFFSSLISNTESGGPAFKGEIGYEFHRHFQIGVYSIVGWAGSDQSSTSHQQLGILLRLMAY